MQRNLKRKSLLKMGENLKVWRKCCKQKLKL